MNRCVWTPELLAASLFLALLLGRWPVANDNGHAARGHG